MIFGRHGDQRLLPSRLVPEDPDRLLTTSEAAKVIGVSRQTLANYARRGLLRPAFRLPTGQLRWRLSSLEQQLAEVDVEDWKRPDGPTPG
jgi:predicted DNA-binding transcriptional regulator AlpA